jgi:hypothetical protein
MKSMILVPLLGLGALIGFQQSDPDSWCVIRESQALKGVDPAVYFTGQAALVDGRAVITLPGHFESCTAPNQRWIQLTCLDGWSPLFASSDVSDGKFRVSTTATGSKTQKFYWEVKGVALRKPTCDQARR